jgi:hypothetical protein
MMEQWEKDKIKEVITELQKEEARKFAIAYAELPEKYHGYLQTLPQKTKIWFKQIDEEFIKELQKEHGWDKVSQWDNKGKWAVYFTVVSPYLGIDGHLAIFTDRAKGHENASIITEVIEIGSRLLAKAQVKIGREEWQGTVEIPEGETVDIPIATAIRKALTYTGDGRFPVHKTPYGDHPMVTKFREFVIEEKKKEN